MVMLAYVLMLNGLLGGIVFGAHVAEARIAAQLGLICTIHGTGPVDSSAPGKLACTEHCVLGSSITMPAVSLAAAAIGPPGLVADTATLPVPDEGCRVAPACLSSLPRGPPAAT